MDNINLKEGFMGQKMITLPKSIISVMRNNLITQNFYISDLGYYPKAQNHFRSRLKGANQYIFIYCTQGEGEINLDGNRINLFPNQFFIIPKKTKHEYKANHTNPWSIYWFHFRGVIALNLYNRYLTNVNKSKDIPYTLKKIKLFEKIYNLFDSNNLENQIEYANLLSLNFISTFIYHNFESHINSNSNNTVVNTIKEFLIDNLDKNFTLDYISSKFNYSKSCLHTKFKIKTGYPIMSFFNLKKIQKACEYLIYTDLSIKEISYKLGFEDPLYFSRIFKNYMGKSPRNYKQDHRKQM